MAPVATMVVTAVQRTTTASQRLPKLLLGRPTLDTRKRPSQALTDTVTILAMRLKASSWHARIAVPPSRRSGGETMQATRFVTHVVSINEHTKREPADTPKDYTISFTATIDPHR